MKTTLPEPSSSYQLTVTMTPGADFLYPGLCDLIYCVDDNSKDANKYRYSQNRRRKETKSRKYAKLILDFKTEKIKGKTVIEHETDMSKFNKKVLNLKPFQEYCREKNKLNSMLFNFYEKRIYGKLKLNAYWNTRKSE